MVISTNLLSIFFVKNTFVEEFKSLLHKIAILVMLQQKSTRGLYLQIMGVNINVMTPSCDHSIFIHQYR